MHYKSILQMKLGSFPPLHRSPSPMFPPSLHVSVGGPVGHHTMCDDEWPYSTFIIALIGY